MPKDNLIPEKYCCAITGRIMAEPVTTSSGNTYEKEAIEEWLVMHDTDPLTNEKLKHKELADNLYARSDISTFLASHPELYEGDEISLPKSWVAGCVMAIKSNSPKEVKKWLDKDRRLSTAVLDANDTALHLACKLSGPELLDTVLKILVQRDQFELVIMKSVNLESNYLNLLLERALNGGYYVQCKLLLDKGAEVDQPEDATHNTLLHRMVAAGNQGAIAWLLDQGAFLENPNAQGNTPLLLSVIEKNQQLADFLLMMNANPEVKNAQQKSPLYIAVENGDIQTARLLLAHGTNPGVNYEPAKRSILHVAAAQGSSAMLRLLLLTKATILIDEQDMNGDTALHLAIQAEFNCDEVILLLLEAGACYKIENEQGRTPIELARYKRKSDAGKLILQTVRAIKRSKQREIEKLQQTVTGQSGEIRQLSALVQELKQAFEHEKKQKEELEATTKKIILNQFNPLKKLLVETLKDPLLKTWQLHTLGQHHCTKRRPIYCVKVLPTGGVASGSLDENGNISIWDVQRGYYLKNLQGHMGAIWALQFLSTGELISASEDHTIKVWDLQNGSCLKTLSGHTGVVRSLQPLSDGKLASGSDDCTIKIWNLESGSCLETLQGHTAGVFCTKLLSNGELVSGSTDNTIRFWNLKNSSCSKNLEAPHHVYCFQELTNGELAVGLWDSTIRIYDIPNGNCFRTLQGHTSDVRYLQLLSNHILASGSGDHTIRLWDVRSGECLKSMYGHIGTVWCLDVLPSGELISVSIDGTIKVWDLKEFTLENDLKNSYLAP